jgi:uncharacterized protein
VSRLSDRLKPIGIQIGTVDKFQGQQAPVVVYSMGTSRPEDAPRGTRISLQPEPPERRNVEAQCAVILVASPHLFTPDCSTSQHMKLADALCRYCELAHVV